MKKNWIHNSVFVIVLVAGVVIVIGIVFEYKRPIPIILAITGFLAAIAAIIPKNLWEYIKGFLSEIPFSLNKVKENILSKIHCPRRKIKVFVIAAPEDMKLAQKIMKVLWKNQICVFPPLDENSGYRRKNLEDKLLLSHGVIVVYDRNTDFSWVKGQIIQCQKRIRAKGVAPKVALMYTVKDKPLKSIELLNDRLVKCPIKDDKFSIEENDCLQSFIEELKNKK